MAIHTYTQGIQSVCDRYYEKGPCVSYLRVFLQWSPRSPTEQWTCLLPSRWCSKWVNTLLQVIVLVFAKMCLPILVKFVWKSSMFFIINVCTTNMPYLWQEALNFIKISIPVYSLFHILTSQYIFISLLFYNIIANLVSFPQGLVSWLAPYPVRTSSQCWTTISLGSTNTSGRLKERSITHLWPHTRATRRRSP